MKLKQISVRTKRTGNSEVFFGERHKMLNMIERGGNPAIATLYSYCLGGGLELPLACHFMITAATCAHIGLPGMDLGTVATWGGSARFHRGDERVYGKTQACIQSMIFYTLLNLKPL
jgi:enoyl-CoA hydratase/carnithine racemase